MPRKKAANTVFEYYEAAACGPHLFFTRALEYVAVALSDKAKIGYHAFLPRAFADIDAFAAEEEAKSLDWLMASIPLYGMSFMKETYSRKRTKISQGSRDAIYEFKGVAKHPVYFGTMCLIVPDYGRPSCISMSFILSYNVAEAIEFLDKLFAARRDRNRTTRCILNFMGEPISDFREMKWGEIFLGNGMVEEIQDEIDSFFANRKLYDDHNLDWRRGCLLAGPAGNGKTALCRAIATTAKVPVVYCVISEGDMFGMLNSVAQTIAQNTPCIAIFEDADTLGNDDALRSALLNMLDGLFTCDGVFTVATTNCPDKLDTAFTGRPSRFDSYYVISNPGPCEREKIILNRLGDKGLGLNKGEVAEIVALSEGLSAACIQEVAVCSLMNALKAKKPVSLAILKESLNKVKLHMKASKDGADKWFRGSMGFNDAVGTPASLSEP